jgi:hypothetical protein
MRRSIVIFTLLAAAAGTSTAWAGQADPDANAPPVAAGPAGPDGGPDGHGDGPGGHKGGPGGPGGRPMFGGLFISPMGEPFRGEGGGEALVTTWFDAADADHDGRLTLIEFQRDALRFFRTLDTDKDGEIAPDELDHYETAIVPEIRVGGGGEGGGRPGGGGRRRGPGGGGGHGGGGPAGGGGGPGGGGGGPGGGGFGGEGGGEGGGGEGAGENFRPSGGAMV